MSSRKIIKQIEVSDFRGLGGSRTLDFDGADIVLLLGLNGFGKTSIFDSIEWCLTGKLARYERYTEAGRRQDFGKEKEVLRNKYSTSPNTYVKVFLENGTTFGRRVLGSNIESDYNMGSTIDGCQFGVSSLSIENVKEELVNSYFSATHILSQDTISDFVTSKKPEDRYKALSVNFGTSIFSAFETNVQAVIGKITELEKNILQQIQSKAETIKELSVQYKMHESDLLKKIADTNIIVEKLNSLRGDFFYKPLIFDNDLVEIASDFEEIINNSKAKTSLNHSDLKEKLNKLAVLGSNVDKWRTGNAELVKTEEEITSFKKNTSDLEFIQKNISKVTKDIYERKEKLVELEVKKVRLSAVRDSLPYFVKIATQIKKLEESIGNRKNSLVSANAKGPALSSALENLKKENLSLLERLKNETSLISEVISNEKLLREYPEQKKSIENKISSTKVLAGEVTTKINKTHAIIKVLADKLSSPASIREIVALNGQVIPDSDKFLERIDKNLQLLSAEEKALSGLANLIKGLETEQSKTKDQFSKSRKVLSEAISLISVDVDNVNCPVCDTVHVSDQLLSHIKSKLGITEAQQLQEIKKKIDFNQDEKNKIAEKIELFRSDFINIIGEIKLVLQSSLSSFHEVETKTENEISSLAKSLNELDSKYSKLITLVDHALESQTRAYDLILNALNLSKVKIEEKANELSKKVQAAEFELSENQKILNEAQGFIGTNLSEIEALKDSQYDDVVLFFEKNGINPSLEKVAGEVDTKFQLLETQISNENEKIRESTNIELEYRKKISAILQDKTEEEYKAIILEKEEKAESIKQSLNVLLQHLTSVKLSPASYSKESIDKEEKVSEENLKKMTEIYSLLEHLDASVKVFSQYNSDRDLRKKLDTLSAEVATLKVRASAISTAKSNVSKLKKQYPAAMKGLIEDNLDVALFNQIYELLNPHRRFKIIDFDVDVNHHKIGINFNAKHSKIEGRPEYLFSSAQLNTFGICMFLSMALRQNWLDLDTILIDDPIQNLDDINVLSFIDFLRGLIDSKTAKKQIILSTHDERFYSLMLKKFQNYKIKTFRFESYGKLVPDIQLL